MQRYALGIEYIGTSYKGWQKQKKTNLTIQEKIEDLISEEVLRGTITEDKPFVLDMKDEEELIVKKGN